MGYNLTEYSVMPIGLRLPNFYLIVGILIGIIIILALLPFQFNIETGKGEHIGYISEIENTGWLWRPTRVTLLNIVTTYSDKDTKWDYGIEPNLIDTAKEFQQQNTKVKVTYEVKRFVWNWDYYSSIVITNITEVR